MVFDPVRRTVRSVSDIKSKLLNPALTSHFEVSIPIPPGLSGTNGRKYFEANGIYQFEGIKQDTLNLLCCETVLPGSNIATIDINSDYHGTTHRHASRRIYDDRIDMTFYVNAGEYLPIRFFEVWMKYIVGESVAQGPEKTEGVRRPGSLATNYFYRINYPTNYVSKSGLSITKFERTGSKDFYSGGTLSYQFVNAFPISISSMPVSYDTSSLLKCTVSFSYVRYVLYPTGSKEPLHSDAQSSFGDFVDPETQAIYNNAQFSIGDMALPGLDGAGALATSSPSSFTVGGVSQQAANSSGNSVRA